MSTFRPATRRIYPRRYRLGRPEEIHATREADRSNGRGIVLAALLCAAVFGGAFVLGRDGRAATAPREAGPWAFPVVSAGAAIPARLSGAPAITVEAPHPKAHTNAHSQPAAATAPAVASQPAESSAPVTPVAPTAPPVVTHSEPASPPPAEAPRQAPPPASKGGSSGAPAPAETGKSFESSG
jgi:hypothetical protein